MRPELSGDIQTAINQQGGGPVELVHPVTHKLYYLITSDQYERLKPLFGDDPPSRQEQRFQIQQAGKRAGWDAPEMDDYDRYDERGPQP